MMLDLERRAGFLPISRNRAHAFRIATRMAMLFQGRIIEDGVPEKFKTSDNPVVRQFVTGGISGPITEGLEHATHS